MQILFTFYSYSIRILFTFYENSIYILFYFSVNQLTIPQLLDLRLIVEATDFLLPGESRLYTLLRSDDEPRALLKLYNAGILSVSQLRRRVEVLPPANPVNRDTMEALANVSRFLVDYYYHYHYSSSSSSSFPVF
jgi:hypothetical protein